MKRHAAMSELNSASRGIQTQDFAFPSQKHQPQGHPNTSPYLTVVCA